MLTKIKVVVYTRVSSEQQNLDMQLEAAKPFIKNYNPDEIIFLNDHGVSATKNKIEDRPKLRELLELIRNDQVDTIIVYQRDRLARDFYEYLEIILLIYTHKVKVIFTATGHLPFNHDIESGIYSEGVFGMLSQIEGMNITNRTRDAFQKAPHSIFGYIVEKLEDKTKTYTINPTYKATIQQLYQDCLSVTSSKELIELLLNYKKVIKRKEDDVFNILIRPFYAGHVEVNGIYERLNHVPPIVTIEQFKEIQSKLHHLVPNLNLAILKDDNLPFIVPKCHKCNSSLVPNNSLDNDVLICKKHNKVFIHRAMLTALIDEVLIDTIRQTNFGQIEKQTLNTLLRLQSMIKEKKDEIQKQFDEIQWKLLTETNFATEKEKMLEKSKVLKCLQDNFCTLVENEVKIEKQILEVKQLVSLVVENLEFEIREYRELMIRTFIKDIKVHEDGYANFELYYSDFYKSKTG